MIKISPKEFTAFSKYIHDISGISLDTGKEYLIETRLGPLMNETESKSYTELNQKAIIEPSKSIEKKIIDAISTNETYFFRDTEPFNLLQHKILPDLIDYKGKKVLPGSKVGIRLWSAANSTGQEIYSIAMIIKDLFMGSSKYDINLLGTDISDAAIAKASYGEYNKFEIARGLTEARLHKYFNPKGDSWKVKDELRAMVTFKKMNLLKPLAGLGKFDIIFCRNVAIYFTPENRKALYRQIAQVLQPDGYLIIGSTESLANDTTLFIPQRYLKSVFYQLKK